MGHTRVRCPKPKTALPYGLPGRVNVADRTVRQFWYRLFSYPAGGRLKEDWGLAKFGPDHSSCRAEVTVFQFTALCWELSPINIVWLSKHCIILKCHLLSFTFNGGFYLMEKPAGPPAYSWWHGKGLHIKIGWLLCWAITTGHTCTLMRYTTRLIQEITLEYDTGNHPPICWLPRRMAAK